MLVLQMIWYHLKGMLLQVISAGTCLKNSREITTGVYVLLYQISYLFSVFLVSFQPSDKCLLGYII